MTVSRLFPLALAFGVALTIAISTVFTFINGYREDLIYQIKRRGGTLKKNSKPYEEATSSYRLPKYIRPISYDIYIHPNLTTFKFSGNVKIKLRCYRQTKKVVLHAHDLRIGEIKIMDSKQKRLRISRGMRHRKKQEYVIIMKEDLREMATYELCLAFNRALSDGLEGFYKSSYKARSGNVRYVNVKNRAIYTRINKTRLYHLYEHVLSKTRTARINGSRLIFVLDSFSCECCP